MQGQQGRESEDTLTHGPERQTARGQTRGRDVKTGLDGAGSLRNPSLEIREGRWLELGAVEAQSWGLGWGWE
jgi:hypothetical protein